MLQLAAFIVLGFGTYWAGPMSRDDGWPEPPRQKLAIKQMHASVIDPGVALALAVIDRE